MSHEENYSIVVLIAIAPGATPAPSYRPLKEGLFKKWQDKEVYTHCLTLEQLDAALEADGFGAWGKWEDMVRALVFTVGSRFDFTDVQAFALQQTNEN